MKGGKMAELVTLFGVLAIGAIYGVYKYSKAETNDFNYFVDQAYDLKIKNRELEQKQHAQDEEVEKLFVKINELEVDISGLQDNCAKLREANIKLNERVKSKKQTVTLLRPVPVEIVEREKIGAKALKKTAEQIKNLSK